VVLTALLVVAAPASRSRAQAPVPLPANALEGGTGWINTRSPIHLRDLRGKVVLLDFWTYCCINCHHVLPDLERLEQKYANQLVVIGVHTAKFDAEKATPNIRQKVAEYRIRHPVINDANQVLWTRFGVNVWPTLVLIDPQGQMRGAVAGEGNAALVDQAIGQLIADARRAGVLNETPLKFEPEVERPHDAPLLYPGKITADPSGKRLFITDTGHNRIVVTDLDGKLVATVGDGEPGLADGPFDKVRFNRPQGTRLVGEILYVADTENHAIRAVDLAGRQVTTVAGNGRRGGSISGRVPARETSLNSPWDILQDPASPETFYIAMAGLHQIWTWDRGSDRVAVWAGSGVENIVDGDRASAAFAQPSGLATDGKRLFVADSEVSGLRAISLSANRVETIVGVGLFGFGDRDGRGNSVRLQHCLGLAFGDGKLFVADSYNNKIKTCEPSTRSVKTLVGARAGGFDDAKALFDEPGGLAYSEGKLYVADTNNHAVRVVDLASKQVQTLRLDGVTPPSPPPLAPKFPGAVAIAVPPVDVTPSQRLALQVTVRLPAGYKINPDAPMPYALAAREGTEGLTLSADVPIQGGRIRPPAETFRVDVLLAREPRPGESIRLELSASAFLCRASLCEIHSYTWTIPIRFATTGASGPIELTTPAP
jgi:thiol-disulfide isomerase/thioredoxin